MLEVSSEYTVFVPFMKLGRRYAGIARKGHVDVPDAPA